MKKKMTRTNIYLTKNQHQKVKEESEKREITFSEMFRKIIDYWYEGK